MNNATTTTTAALMGSTAANLSSSSSEEAIMDNNNATDTLGGHLVAGCFLLAFGGFFLGLTAFRLNRIAAALAFLERIETSPRSSGHGAAQHHDRDDSSNGDENNHSHHHSHGHAMTVMTQGNHSNSDQQHHHHTESSSDDPSDHVTLWARTYCRQHIPEYNTTVVYRTSLALLVCTISGLLLESVGGVWIHFEDHPDCT